MLTNENQKLLDKILDLENQQRLLSQEISSIKTILIKEEKSALKTPIVEKVILKSEEPTQNVFQEKTQNDFTSFSNQPNKKDRNLEKFIGENLISKIGILLTLIGVVFGFKFAIDHDLISPVFRVVTGYIFALILFLFSFKLKAKYFNYSAVLHGGAIAIAYFVTYFAYSLYHLYPHLLAFSLMLMLTTYTVVQSVLIKQQIVSILGFVAAFAIPFLLSTGQAQMLPFLSYVTLLNLGILVVKWFHNWGPLAFVSFVFTWVVYGSWLFSKYDSDHDFSIALVFYIVFYLLFYIQTVVIQIKKHKSFADFDMLRFIFLQATSFLLGYYLVHNQVFIISIKGPFTLVFSAISLLTYRIVPRETQGASAIKSFSLFLALFFLGLFVPIQWDGNWVSMGWAGLAVAFFAVNTSRKLPYFTAYSFVLASFSLVSLVQDISLYYPESHRYIQEKLLPFGNLQFLYSLLQLLIVSYLVFLFYKHRNNLDSIFQTIAKFFTAFFIVFGLGVVWHQINYLFVYEVGTGAVKVEDGFNSFSNSFPFFYYWFRDIYFFVFGFIVLVFGFKINQKYLQSIRIQTSMLYISILFVVLFFILGLMPITKLQQVYLEPYEEFYPPSFWFISIRYIALGALALISFVIFKHARKLAAIQPTMKLLSHIFIFALFFIVLSNELIYDLGFNSFKNNSKLSLSILWAVMASFWIVLGIWKSIKIWRILGVVLFGITLLKLLFYDMSHMSVLTKTFVFVIVGLIMLAVSYLYNRFKGKIT